jgi:hypothetical protein
MVEKTATLVALVNMEIGDLLMLPSLGMVNFCSSGEKISEGFIIAQNHLLM